MNNRRRAGVGEVAGGTAAECAAVCCCFPLTVMKFVVTVVYKVPASLCQRVIKNKKKNKVLCKKALLQPPWYRNMPSFDDMSTIVAVLGNDQDAASLEAEVLEKFHGTGFWRSPSQRDSS